MLSNLPATVPYWGLSSQHAPLQLAGHDLPLLLQLPSQSLELKLLQEVINRGDYVLVEAI